MTQAGAGVEAKANDALITGNYIHDLIIAANSSSGSWGADGIMLNNSSDDVVSYNRLINCVAPSAAYGLDGGGVEFFAAVSNVAIHHNYANNVNGFTKIGSNGATDSNDLWADNVVINSGPMVGIHIGGTWATYVNGLQVLNNTIVAGNNTNGSNFFYLNQANTTGFTAADLLVRNNILYASGTSMAVSQEGNSVPFTHDHNIYYGLNLNVTLAGSELSADPKFVNATTGNYALEAGSPAIGAGQAPAPYATDYAGDPVPSANGVDLGAYEYGSQASPTSTPTVAPTATSAPTAAPTAAPTVTPAPTASLPNLLKDGSFESGISPWLLQVDTPASASASLDTGNHAADGGTASAKVNVAAGDASDPYYVQLRQSGVELCAGCRYQLAFWAKAAAGRSVQAAVQGVNSPYNIYLNQTVAPGTAWQKYTYEFTPSQSDTAFVGFNLGSSASTVWIDGVTLTGGLLPEAFLPYIGAR